MSTIEGLKFATEKLGLHLTEDELSMLHANGIVDLSGKGLHDVGHMFSQAATLNKVANKSNVISDNLLVTPTANNQQNSVKIGFGCIGIPFSVPAQEFCFWFEFIPQFALRYEIRNVP